MKRPSERLPTTAMRCPVPDAALQYKEGVGNWFFHVWVMTPATIAGLPSSSLVLRFAEGLRFSDQPPRLANAVSAFVVDVSVRSWLRTLTPRPEVSQPVLLGANSR